MMRVMGDAQTPGLIEAALCLLGVGRAPVRELAEAARRVVWSDGHE